MDQNQLALESTSTCMKELLNKRDNWKIVVDLGWELQMWFYRCGEIKAIVYIFAPLCYITMVKIGFPYIKR